jgi:hypothetical protein
MGALVLGCASKRAAQQQMSRAEQKQAAAERKRDAEEQKRLASERKEHAKRDKIARREQAERDEETRRQQARDARKRAADERWAFAASMMQRENEPTLVDDFAKSSAASGAAQDANFSDAHFTGNELNALGRSKLALVIDGAAGKDLTIFIAGEKDAVQPRADSIVTNLKNPALGEQHLQTKPGRNPATSTPASINLRGLQKLEKGDSAEPPTNFSLGSLADVMQNNPSGPKR